MKQILEQNKEFNQKLDNVKNALVNGFNGLKMELMGQRRTAANLAATFRVDTIERHDQPPAPVIP